MKVLFITHTAGMGGANHSLFQLMKELKDNYKIEPILLAPKEKFPLTIVDKCKDIGVECIYTYFFWFKGRQLNIKNIIKILLNVAVCYPYIIWKLRGYHFDLIHSNGSVISIGGYISRIKKTKHIWHLREFGMLDFGIKSLLGLKYERFIYGLGDCFIAISDAIKREYTSVIPEQKIKLIYNGIKPQSEQLSSTHDNEILHFVITGLVQETKSQIDAVKAFEIVLKSSKLIHLNIIGIANNDYGTMIKRYISEKGLNDYVTFWGVRDDVPQLLSKMDVGLMLSKCEAFGRVTVEYMLQNLAVIASDTGANLEIIDDGIDGLIYHNGDVHDLAEKMITLIADKKMLLSIAKAGKKRALENFTSEKNTHAIYNVYMNLLSN